MNLAQLNYQTQKAEALKFDKTMLATIPNAKNPCFAEGMCKSHDLPSAYQEVEWLGSDGPPYLDLGFAPNADVTYVYELDFQMLYFRQYVGVFGAYSSETNITTRVIVRDTGGTSFFLYYGSKASGGSRATIAVNSVLDRFKLTFSDIGYTLHDYTTGTVASGSLSTTTPGTDSNATFKLFRYSSGSVPSKFWSAKVWHSGVLIRNMVPCYRKSDSVIGMYDLVNNVFYANAGTGTFTKGADVPTGSLVANSGDGGMKIEGKSVQRGVVQLVQNGNFESTDLWTPSSRLTNFTVSDNTASVEGYIDGAQYFYHNMNYVKGHKYYVQVFVKPSVSIGVSVRNRTQVSSSEVFIYTNATTANIWNDVSGIHTYEGIYDYQAFNITFYNNLPVGETAQLKNCMLIDLTAMFGAGNEPTTVQEFRSMYPDAYYEYSTTGAPTPSQPVPIWSVGKRDVLHPVQLLKNGNFANGTSVWGTNWGTGESSGTISAENNICTFTTKVSDLPNRYSNEIYQSVVPVPMSHKIFVSYKIKSSVNTYTRVDFFESSSPWYSMKNSSFFKISANQWTEVSAILVNSGFTRDARNFMICLQGGPDLNTLSAGDTVQIAKVNCIDLTATYGAGNEPTTVEQFRADYLAEYYPYLASANNNRAVYDTNKIGCVDLGTLNWSMSTTSQFSVKINGMKSAGLNVAKVFCAKYTMGDSTIDQSFRTNSGWFAIYDTSYTDVATFKSAMSGVLLYYELADTALQTTTIPLTELRGINGVCDTLEPRVWHDGAWRSRLTRRIGSVDLGTLTWSRITSFGEHPFFRAKAYDRDTTSDHNGLITHFAWFNYSTLTSFGNNAPNFSFGLQAGDNYGIVIRDDDYTASSKFASAVSGVMFYHQLETPVITYGEPIDIQSYAGETNCFSDSIIQPTICMTAVTHQ